MNINIQLVKRTMKDQGITHKELAGVLGIAQSRFSQILNRGSASIKRLEVIANYLNLKYDEIIIPDGESSREVFDRLVKVEKQVSKLKTRVGKIESDHDEF